MAATCPKCLEQLPRQVLWKGLKSGTPPGALTKAEIICPQCRQVLRITPKSLLTILALAILPTVPITLWFIFFLTPPRLDVIPHAGFGGSDAPDDPLAMLIVLYPRLARFREKPRPFSIRG